MLNNPATRDVGGLTYRRREDGDVIITEYLFEAPPIPLRRPKTSSAELRRDRRKPRLFLVSSTIGTHHQDEVDAFLVLAAGV